MLIKFKKSKIYKKIKLLFMIQKNILMIKNELDFFEKCLIYKKNLEIFLVQKNLILDEFIKFDNLKENLILQT